MIDRLDDNFEVTASGVKKVIARIVHKINELVEAVNDLKGRK